MFTYTSEMKDKMKFDFENSISRNYSQALQDMFVLSVLNGKTNGTFLEIGAHDPVECSNTNLLETGFNWSGVSLDILDLTSRFSSRPNTKFMCSNAITLDYKTMLKENYKGNRIDYLSLDIEPNYNTFECLKNLPLDEYRFSVITYETDVYDPAQPKENNEWVRRESRIWLTSRGYTRVNGNVSNLDNEHPFEDWYLDNEFFEPDIIEKFMRESDEPLAAHLYMLK